MDERMSTALELLREVASGGVGFRGLEHAPRCYEGTPAYSCKCGLDAWLKEVRELERLRREGEEVSDD